MHAKYFWVPLRLGTYLSRPFFMAEEVKLSCHDFITFRKQRGFIDLDMFRHRILLIYIACNSSC